jgi:hypothetical protein
VAQKIYDPLPARQENAGHLDPACGFVVVNSAVSHSGPGGVRMVGTEDIKAG